MRFLSLALLVTSLPSFACPDLAGLYRRCVSTQGEVSKLRVVQNDDTFRISWSTERLIIAKADGVTRTTPIFDTGMAWITVASCEGDTLKRHIAYQTADGQIDPGVDQSYRVKQGLLHYEARDQDGVFKEVNCR